MLALDSLRNPGKPTKSGPGHGFSAAKVSRVGLGRPPFHFNLTSSTLLDLSELLFALFLGHPLPAQEILSKQWWAWTMWLKSAPSSRIWVLPKRLLPWNHSIICTNFTRYNGTIDGTDIVSLGITGKWSWRNNHPYHPCMAYLPTFGWFLWFSCR